MCYIIVENYELEEKNMNSTALGAGAGKDQEIIFISEAHEFGIIHLNQVNAKDRKSNGNVRGRRFSRLLRLLVTYGKI